MRRLLKAKCWDPVFIKSRRCANFALQLYKWIYKTELNKVFFFRDNHFKQKQNVPKHWIRKKWITQRKLPPLIALYCLKILLDVYVEHRVIRSKTKVKKKNRKLIYVAWASTANVFRKINGQVKSLLRSER